MRLQARDTSKQGLGRSTSTTSDRPAATETPKSRLLQVLVPPLKRNETPQSRNGQGEVERSGREGGRAARRAVDGGCATARPLGAGPLRCTIDPSPPFFLVPIHIHRGSSPPLFLLQIIVALVGPWEAPDETGTGRDTPLRAGNRVSSSRPIVDSPQHTVHGDSPSI
jgi:hypothetical protein